MQMTLLSIHGDHFNWAGVFPATHHLAPLGLEAVDLLLQMDLLLSQELLLLEQQVIASCCIVHFFRLQYSK